MFVVLLTTRMDNYERTTVGVKDFRYLNATTWEEAREEVKQICEKRVKSTVTDSRKGVDHVIVTVTKADILEFSTGQDFFTGEEILINENPSEPCEDVDEDNQ